MKHASAPVEGSQLWTVQRLVASATIPTRCGAAAIARVSHSPCSSHACLNRWRSSRAFSSSPFRITFFCALKHFSSRYFCSLHAPVSRPQYPTSSWHCLKANILSTHSGLLCSDSVGCMRPGWRGEPARTASPVKREVARKVHKSNDQSSGVV